MHFTFWLQPPHQSQGLLELKLLKLCQKIGISWSVYSPRSIIWFRTTQVKKVNPEKLAASNRQLIEKSKAIGMTSEKTAHAHSTITGSSNKPSHSLDKHRLAEHPLAWKAVHFQSVNPLLAEYTDAQLIAQRMAVGIQSALQSCMCDFCWLITRWFFWEAILLFACLLQHSKCSAFTYFMVFVTTPESLVLNVRVKQFWLILQRRIFEACLLWGSVYPPCL